MREIKFRAWDKLEEKMVEVNRIDLDEREVDVVIEKSKSVESYYSCSFYEIELMQYTGLKDKNGVEIYEGDFIRENDGDGGYIYAEVVYHNCGFMGKEKGFEPEYPISAFRDEVEVIGNIYENPELFEVR